MRVVYFNARHTTTQTKLGLYEKLSVARVLYHVRTHTKYALNVWYDNRAEAYAYIFCSFTVEAS